MRVRITDIRTYEHNPRVEPNAAYEKLKRAILIKRGLDQQLTITRRPGEEDGPFILYAGGGTRLEILAACFSETKDEAFLFADCLFKPYTSEFDLMVAHAGENENRENLMWIDKARHIKRLRSALEKGSGRKVSQHELTQTITQHGWSITQQTVSRLEYTHDSLLPAIPKALSGGFGEPRVRKVSKLEKSVKKYLQHRHQPNQQIVAVNQWFFDTLKQHDSEEWDFDPLFGDIMERLADICDEPVPRVCLAVEGLMQGSPLSPRAPPATLSWGASAISGKPPAQKQATGLDETAPEDAHSSRSGSLQDVLGNTQMRAPTSTTAEQQRGAATLGAKSGKTKQKNSSSLKDLRARMGTLARQLAQPNQLDHYIHWVNAGPGFVIDLPATPISDAKQIALWWFLVAAADQALDGRSICMKSLPDNTRLALAFQAEEARGDTAVLKALTTYVSEPPSLQFVLRDLLGRLHDSEFETLVSLLHARRQLESVCLSEGKTDVWEL
jgi:ParB family protein of integrating conjugative element (PFGI_1 class)